MLNQLGEPFDETTPDGREVTAVCTLEDGKIISVQKAKKDGDKSTKVDHYMSLCYCLYNYTHTFTAVCQRDEWSR